MTSYEVNLSYGENSLSTFSGAEGLKVYNQLLHKMDVRAISTGDDEGDVFIPYHSINFAAVQTTTTEDPEVVDAVCNETNS